MSEPEFNQDLAIEDVLEQLVSQFVEPLCFLRELVQNAIDAGSTKVDVSCTFEDDSPLLAAAGGLGSGDPHHGKAAELGTAIIRVVDFGEGMDGHIIDTRLTRLFSSDKEGDRTKLGKFGTGFISVFALQPDAVCVDTGRYGESWRLVFQPDHTFTRIRLSEPVDGTTVRLFKTMQRGQFETLARRVRRTLLRDCPHVEVALRYQGELLSRPLGLEALEAPVKTVVKAHGATIVVGFTPPGAPGRATLYGRGLTLLGRPSELVGISYKIDSPALEHTHSRDGVLRGEHYQALMTTVKSLASGELVEELFARLETGLKEKGPSEPAAELVKWQRCVADLLRRGAVLPAACAQRLVACSPHGELYTLLACQEAARAERLYSATESSPLSAAAVAAGELVLSDWQTELLLALGRSEPPRLERTLVLPLPLVPKDMDETRWAGAEALRTAVLLLVRAAEGPVAAVELGSLNYPGSGAGELPCVVQAQPFAHSRLATAHPKDQHWPEPGDEKRQRSTWVLNADHLTFQTLLPLAESEPELCAYFLTKLCLVGSPQLGELNGRLLTLSLEQRTQRQEAPLIARQRLLTSLTRIDGEIVSSGSFTIDPERVRDKLRRSRFENPLRYVLELVQAASLKGATHLEFRFGADDMQLRFNGEPFAPADFEQLYSALLHRGEGREGQARNLLALGLCAALQLDPALIHVESGESFVELRPGQPDRLGTLPERVPLTQIRVRHRLGLDLLKRYVDHLGGHLTEQLLLQERCHHACMAIELDGEIISQGHTFPNVAFSRTFSSDGISGTVAIAPLPAAPPTESSVQLAPAAVPSSSFLRLIKNGVWVDTQLPIELLPGFLALAESSAYRLDISREHVVQDSQYAAALRAVAAAQVELLAALCERSAQGPFMDVGHLRALLRGLLSRLGGLAPLLRWAQLPVDEFPPEVVTEGSSLWPLEVEKGAALLEVPIFYTTIGDMIPLRVLLDDLAQHRTIAYSSYRSREPDPKRPVVLYLAEPGDRDVLHDLFGSALTCRDAAIQLAWKREHNRAVWLSRTYQPRLTSQQLLARAPLTGDEFTGEVGIESGPQVLESRERLLNRPCTLRLLLIKDGCLLVEKRVPFPAPDLNLVVMGNFTPSYLFDDVVSDGVLTQVVDALMDALPALIEQLALVPTGQPEVAAPSGALAWRACVLRRLLMLVLSPEARKSARAAMGVATPSADSAGQLIPHPLWMQLEEVQLFEALDGTLLRPRELTELVHRTDSLPVLCPSPTVLPRRLATWTALGRSDSDTKKAWYKAHSQWPTRVPLEQPPRLILYLAPAERALLSELAQQLPALRLVDAEPWLRSVETIAAQSTRHAELLLLPKDCEVAVPLVGIEGVLGLIEESEFLEMADGTAAEPRITVALFRERRSLGSGELYLPGGQFLSAVADHPQLQLDPGGKSLDENEALVAVRTGIAAALPELLAALAEHSLPWPTLYGRVLLTAATALFPSPAFRRAYDRLCSYCSRGDYPGRRPEDAEREYGALLRLTVATSLTRVEAVLQRHLDSDEPLSVFQVTRELLPVLAESWEAVPPDREAAELTQATQLPPGAMAWIDTLYPDSEGLPFGERVLLILPALAEAPLLVTPTGASLTLEEVLADYQEHGHVLLASGKAPPPAATRPLISDPDGLLLPLLHCLFGASKVHELSALPLPVPPPPLLAPPSWPLPRPVKSEGSAGALGDRLLAAVLQELRAVRGRNERLLNNVNLAWLQLRESEQPRAVICDSQQFIINRRHPTVQRVLRSSPIDPQSVRFFASAVYTALSTRLAGAYLADAAHFHRHLAARALAETAETQQRGPGRPASSKVSMNPA